MQPIEIKRIAKKRKERNEYSTQLNSTPAVLKETDGTVHRTLTFIRDRWFSPSGLFPLGEGTTGALSRQVRKRERATARETEGIPTNNVMPPGYL